MSRLLRLLSKRVLRSLAPRPVRLSTGRFPRFRVFIPSNAKDLLVGQKVGGKYYVLSVLGHGGMSVVYKARSLSGKKRRIVALKALRVQDLSNEVVVQRFQREVKTLSSLNHPRIVQVYDYGTTKLGQPYFIMDYLTGGTLAAVLKQIGCLNAERFRNIFSQVCGAVDHAHRCGIIHRDLKPGNIMLSIQNGQPDFVKVVDFGIARFEEEAQRLTRMGEIWGSPIYMSPEQCMGAPLDVRSDIYSLGVVMYESLTGVVPFVGKTYVDTMTKQIGEAPRSMKILRTDLNIPLVLDNIVLKTLNKEPDSRYQTMAELRDEIEKAVPRKHPAEASGTVPAIEEQPERPKSIHNIRTIQAKREWLQVGSGGAIMAAAMIILMIAVVAVFCVKFFAAPPANIPQISNPVAPQTGSDSNSAAEKVDADKSSAPAAQPISKGTAGGVHKRKSPRSHQ